MAGNVWEWTSTIHSKYPYNQNDGREDLIIFDLRVMKGGLYWDTEKKIRCVNRINTNESMSNL